VKKIVWAPPIWLLL